jgi:hypothetical protein
VPSLTRVSPNDPALPILNELLPPDGAPHLVADWLSRVSNVDVDSTAATLTYVRYLPGESCVLGWSLPTASGDIEHITAWAFANDALAQDAMSRSRARRTLQIFGTRQDQHLLHLPDRALVLQRFPLDLRLPALVRALSPAWIERRIAAALPDGCRDVTGHLLHYNPLRRCVVRYDAHTPEGPSSYFAKFYRGKRGARLLGINQSVSKHLAAANAPWLVPAPRAYLERPHALVFDAAPDSHRLYPVLSNAHEHRDELLAVATRAIAGLAHFRSAPVSGTSPRTPSGEIASLRRLAQSLPANDTKASIAAMIDRLESITASLPPEPLVLAHGRFRVEQFMASSTDLFLIDLDTVSTSGACADPGNLLAYLDLAALRFPRGASAIRASARAAEAVSLEHGLASPRWLAWHRALVHVQKAVRAYLSLHVDPDATALALLQLAQAALIG